MEKKEFPKVKGVVKKWTKSGQRYLLHGKDLSGKDIYVTIPIEDTDTDKEYFEKIRNARIKLCAKKNKSKIEDLIDEYVEKRQLAESTEKTLRAILRPFSLDNNHNVSVVKAIINGSNKPSTLVSKIGSIHRFFRWLVLAQKVDGIIDPTIDFKVKCPLTHRTRTLTEIEESRLISYVSRLNDLEARLIILLALYTGARISSICALTKNSLRDGNIYYWNVKCNKPYDYPIPIRDPQTIELFSALSEKTDNKLFTKRKAIRYASMIDQRLYKLFGKDSKGETITIHSLRHTFATKAIQSGVPPEIISRLLDHASPATTLRIYAKHSQQQIEDAIDKIFVAQKI